MARATISENIATGGRTLVVELERNLGMDAKDEASLLRQSVREGIKKIAEQWVEENRDKIIERLNVDAVANMIMLEAAATVNNNIMEKVEWKGRIDK